MKAKLTIAILAILISAASVASPPAEQGKAIFSARCAACHNINKVLTGPALAGVHERRSMDWIISFVKSSQSLVKSGDKDAVALFEKFNKMPMPDHSDLSADDIKSVVEFIKAESKTIVGEKALFAKPSKLHPKYAPLSITADYGVFLGFFAAIILLIAAMLFAVQLKEYERSRVDE